MLRIYFSLYLVIIIFYGLVWSLEIRSHQKKQFLFFIFWFITASEDE